MSVTPIGAPASPITGADTFVQDLMKGIDTNQDGQISGSEFLAFLTNLIGKIAPNSAAGKALAPTATGDTPDPATSDPVTPGSTSWAQAPPSSWTDNNAPYGITFAGFSPQNHTDLTLADLGTPGKAEKYAAYDYLLSNKVEPTDHWAPAAAEALNQKYNTDVYHAIDGETLGFGKEYIHSAPNGYAMAWTTFNPTARGEFFWGSA